MALSEGNIRFRKRIREMAPFLVCISCCALLLLKWPSLWHGLHGTMQRAFDKINCGAHVLCVWIQTASDNGLFL